LGIIAEILALENPTDNGIINAILAKQEQGLFELDLSNAPTITQADINDAPKTLPWEVIFANKERIAYTIQ
jgi:hypothetical protein